ncbi:cation diffusion facilitator family transporter [Polymorphobacter sp. PAMC 29334]|uniref:cation diffusion facilitator family transporter n=1 Tax=Polymorphobacter sp. PAMC 29334 TaxID=2862331 RepID=UPI001C75D699|nr:cation diffusion facilitator family transporter [Polymorphobacter sp. PAMC 29334]QYE34472.1 cation diffusion facilitator family transporter [Polymorphobacter sp. PAMC 29334]
MSTVSSSPNTSPPSRATLTRRAAIASVSSATVLLVLKAWAASATGSVAMLGSLADTGLDLLSSCVTLYAVWLAGQPADEDHRFGHGKAEAIAALMQTLVILGSAVAIGVRAAMEIGTRTPPQRADVGIGVSVVAVALTLCLVAYQRHVVRMTQSIAIVTDQVHYESDLLLNLAVIAAFALEAFAGLHGADAVFGIGIALYLAYGAITSARAALDMLMDREWPDEKRQTLLGVVARHPQVDGVHELRTRSSGVVDFIQFHIWLSPEMSVRCAHDIVDEIEADVATTFPGAEIMIHIDPLGHYDRPQVLRA